MKRLVLGVLGVILMSHLVACGNGADNQSRDFSDLPEPRFEPDATIPSWQQDADHEATLTWYINFDWWANDGWGADVVTRKLEADLNIKIEFISGNDENLNTMMAGGDLPDLITLDQSLSIANEGEQFAFPLDILAEKYDPYFLEQAAKPDTLKWYTQEDGHIYAYPSFSTVQADFDAGHVEGDQVMIVRRDIYEAIGEPDMTTPAGFLAALRLARDFAPTTDSGANLVPFAGTAMDIAHGGDGAFGWVLQDFLGIPVSEDGAFYDRDEDPEYLNWLLILRQAYEEGLITNDQFSDNDNTMKEKLSQGSYFAYMHSNIVGLPEFLSDNNRRHPDQEYIVVAGPTHSNGNAHTFSGGGIGGWTNTFITTSTEDPQTAMQVLTYFTSEYGNMVNSFGVEGETYELIDGKAVFTDEVAKLRDTDFARYNKEIGTGTYWFVADAAFAIAMGEQAVAAIDEMVQWSSQFAVSRFEMENIEPEPGSRLARNLNTVNTDRVQGLVAVIQAPDDETGTQIWHEFLASRENHSWQDIIGYRNEKMAQNIEVLELMNEE